MIAIGLGVFLYAMLALFAFGMMAGAVAFGRKENRPDEIVVLYLLFSQCVAVAAGLILFACLQAVWEHLP